MDFKVSTLKELGTLEVAKLFWGASFKSEISKLSEIYNDDGRQWEIRLTNYCEEAKCNMITFIRNGNLPICLQHNLENSILSLQVAYHQLFLWKITYDPQNWIELFQEGDLYAPRYFNSLGEFNDLIFSKRFVLQSRYSIISRFNLACCYWFEHESENLWTKIKCSYFHFDEDFLQPEFLELFNESSSMIFLRIKHMEELSKKSHPARKGDDDFWLKALRQTIENGYEHATYYSWKKLSLWKKISFMNDDDFFELLCIGSEYPKDKISLFLFLQLSEERKINLLDWTIENYRPEIWYTLLITPYAKDIHKEVLFYYSKLPTEMCSMLFQLIAERIRQLKILSDMALFEELWRSLKRDERYFTLRYSSIFIETLATAKSFDNLSLIIKSLSSKQKWKCLLYNRYGAGITVLHTLVKSDEYDFLQKYLYIFLMNYPCIRKKDIPCFHQETVREDAHLLLQEFVDSSNFKTWYERVLSDEQKIQVKTRIEKIFGSLVLLNIQRSS